MALSLLLWLVWRRPDIDISLPQAALFIASFAISTFLLNTLFDPKPLPEVRLGVEGANTPISGALVASTGDTWYVAGPNNHVSGYPAGRVLKAVVDTRQYERASLYGVIFGCELIND